MTFILYSPMAFERWDHRNLEWGGIGGSETSHIEMAQRLARRGHEVISYAPIPDDCPPDPSGVDWRRLEQVDWRIPGTWIVYRNPAALDNFLMGDPSEHQRVWLLMQDWSYADWTPRRIATCDAIIALSKCAARHFLRTHPEAKPRMRLESNGINVDRIALIEQVNTYVDGNGRIFPPIVRNPKRIMYTSSPDRGLKPALLSFRRAYAKDSALELHCYYGFQNFDKVIANDPSRSYTYSRMKSEILELLDQPGVTFHERVDQATLYHEWLQSGIWLYQTAFPETSCISCMEAQAMGAVPLFSPVFAQKENVEWGIGIDGDPEDRLTNARFAAELVALANEPHRQEAIRAQMMPWAREKYDWDRAVDVWVKHALPSS